MVDCNGDTVPPVGPHMVEELIENVPDSPSTGFRGNGILHFYLDGREVQIEEIWDYVLLKVKYPRMPEEFYAHMSKEVK